MKARYLLIASLFLPFGLTGQLIDSQTPLGARPDNATVPASWDLAFSDEFNDDTIDPAKWNIDDSPSSRAPRPGLGINAWFWRPDNVSEVGGNLKLRVDKVNTGTMHCGSINSRNKYEPLYGYYEARIQIAEAAKATHTAFWLQGANMGNVDNSGHDGAEIDIFESAWLQDFTKAVSHIDGYGPDRQADTKQYNTPGIHSGFHTYGMSWAPGQIKIYYDGVLKATFGDKWVPRVGEWLWLSDGASFGFSGTNFTDEPVGELTNAYVDYVRVWQAQPIACNDPVIEMESLVTASSGAQTAITSNAGASAGAHVRLLANSLGDEITFDLCTDSDAYYTYQLTSLTFNGFGWYQASIEASPGVWKTFPGILDMYSNGSSTRTFTLPEIFLTTGGHQLRFTNVGRNPSAANFIGSFDRLDVTVSNEQTACIGDNSISVMTAEAEDVTLSGSSSIVSCATASASEHARFNAIGDAATLTINVAEAGSYNLIAGYFAKNNPRAARVNVNGVNTGLYVFSATGDWCFEGGSPGEAIIPVSLVAGNNTIGIQSVNTTPPLLDYVEVTGPCALLSLPVELTELQAEAEAKSVFVSWTTSREINNDYFAVERSTDGQSFIEIGRQAGAGATETANSYWFEDTAPQTGTNFYRLRQVDYDGTFAYSSVVSANFSREISSDISIFPTLLRNDDLLNISLPSNEAAGQRSLFIIDQLGRRMSKVLVSGQGNNQVSVAGLNPGIYYLMDVRGKLPLVRFVVAY